MCHSLFSQNLFQPKGIRKKNTIQKRRVFPKRKIPLYLL